MKKLKYMSAIFKKDIKDLKQNGQLLFLIICQIVGGIPFYIIDQENVLLSMNISIIAVLLVMYAQGNLVVEEKEQNTLIVLQYRGMNYWDIILPKSILTLILFLIALTMWLFLYGYSLTTIIIGVIFISPLFIMFNAIGSMIGLISKNTVDVSLYGWPIILLYLLLDGVMYYPLVDRLNIFFITPNYHFHHGIQLLIQERYAEMFLHHSAVPLVWAIILLYPFHKILKKH